MTKKNSLTDKQLAAAADALCKKLMIGLLALLVALFVAQAALRFDYFRHWASSIERLEGEPIAESGFCIP